MVLSALFRGVELSVLSGGKCVRNSLVKSGSINDHYGLHGSVLLGRAGDAVDPPHKVNYGRCVVSNFSQYFSSDSIAVDDLSLRVAWRCQRSVRKVRRHVSRAA